MNDQDMSVQDTSMETVEIRDPKFRSVVGDAVTFERIATGFLFTEGPLWHAVDQYLLFSDMPGDHLRKWSERGGVNWIPRNSPQLMSPSKRHPRL